MNRQDWERLNEIRDQLDELIQEADKLVRRSGDKFAYERAKAYWLGYLQNAIDGGSLAGCDMEETIDALEPEEVNDNA